MTLSEEPTRGGLEGPGWGLGPRLVQPWELPLTEKVVQDEPIEYVLLQAADHDVLGEEFGIDPLHQHLQTPGGQLTPDHSSPGPPRGSVLTLAQIALLPPANSYPSFKARSNIASSGKPSLLSQAALEACSGLPGTRALWGCLHQGPGHSGAVICPVQGVSAGKLL